MQPIVFNQTHDGKTTILRAWSNRLTIINSKNYKVMREIDFVDHETALFFAEKLSQEN